MTTKRCQSCGEHLPHDRFNKNKHRADGLHTQCKPCCASYRKKTLDKRRKYIQEYRAVKGDKMRAYAKSWRIANPAKRNAASAKRHAAKLNATPHWLTQEHLDQIEMCYVEALALRMYTGQEYHVDHIVPLQGKAVCGLHVPWNLRVILAKDNLAKSNTLEVQT